MVNTALAYAPARPAKGGKMGFKCPVCLKDFKRDKKEWEKHCAEKHLGSGKDILEAIKKISGDKEGR